MRPLSCFLAAVMMLLSATGARAQQDSWFGPDKALHLVAGAALAAGAYTLGGVAFERRGARVAIGVSVGIGAGAAKELRDRRSGGTPSWRDFAWTAAGTAAGVGTAWWIDRMRERADAPREAAARPAAVSSAR